MAEIKTNKKAQPNFIRIKPDGLEWGFHAHFKKEENGMFSWYIPSFDIFFSSNTKEQGDQIGIDATQAFFEFWLRKQGFRKFVNKILSLGYKPSSFQELKDLLHRRSINANLEGTIRKLPKSFAGADERAYSGEMKAAV